MSFFRPKAPAAPRIQTLAEMIAYALTSEATRTGWRATDKILRHDGLGLKLEFRWSRLGYLATVTGRKSKGIPFSERDRCAIEDAARGWQRWDDDRQRTEELLDFVDRFEAATALAAGARSDETTQLAQPVGRQSGGDSRNAQKEAPNADE